MNLRDPFGVGRLSGSNDGDHRHATRCAGNAISSAFWRREGDVVDLAARGHWRPPLDADRAGLRPQDARDALGAPPRRDGVEERRRHLCRVDRADCGMDEQAETGRAGLGDVLDQLVVRGTASEPGRSARSRTSMRSVSNRRMPPEVSFS